MAEDNTTDSTPTEETTAPPADSSTSSTTPTAPAPQPPAEETDDKTILTDPPKPDEPKETPEENTLYGAPEGEYEVVGLPEGTVIDKDAIAAVGPIAKELNLSNEGFSKLAGVYAEQVLPKVVNGLTEQLQTDIVAQHKAWGDETIELIKSDPVFDGKQLTQVQQVAAKAIDRFGGDGLRDFLKQTGMGNHPDMVRFAYLAGSAISEDTTFERGDDVGKPKTSVEKFYGTS